MSPEELIFTCETLVTDKREISFISPKVSSFLFFTRVF